MGPMRAGLGRYLWAALTARPKGMFISPNLVALATIGVLGLVNPGIWMIGAGLELWYLLALVTNRRFRAAVDAADGSSIGSRDGAALERQVHLLNRLDEAAQAKYRSLARGCMAVLKDHHETGAFARSLHETLGGLLWVYLQLLVARGMVERALQRGDDDPRESIEQRLASVNKRLAGANVDPELRRSLEGQRTILSQRQEAQREAREKLAYIDAELARVQEQVALVREQALLSAEPETAAVRIDAIASSLGATTQWIRDQKRLDGLVQDVLVSPPALEDQARAAESTGARERA